ncbi:MAG: hypothetical protein P8L20_08750 [Flavobacteriales bacterium]|nr:hypothetical protein [Flavobacteriales bacterium]
MLKEREFSNIYMGSLYEAEKNSSNFNEKTNTYYSYFQPFAKWSIKEYKEFVMFSNKVLTDYKVEFVGETKELFNKTNTFSSNLIEEFGENPNTNEEDYLSFLYNYGRE